MRRPLIVRPAWLICAVPSAVSPVGAGPPPRIYRWEKTTAVAVKIKLKRLGKIREPYYRIVVADARTKRDGRAIEEIGKYHPKADPSLIEVNSERVQYWLSVGAQPTDPVRVLLKVTGDWQKFTGEPGSEGTLRTASPRGDKKEAFAAAAKASQASKDKDKDKDKASGSAKAATQSRPAQDGRAKPAKETGGRAKAASPKAEAAPAEAAPVEAAPVEAAPAEVAPVEVAEAAPVEATPVEAPPVEAPSAEAAPAEAADTAPAEAAEAAPAEAAEAAPAEAAEAAPAEAAEAAPAEAAEAAPAEAAEAAPAEAAEATPAEADEPAAEATADAGTEA
jgi:small subunit ribosomal protein S16